MFAPLEVLHQELVMARGVPGKSFSSSGFGDCIWSQAGTEEEKGWEGQVGVLRDSKVPLEATASGLRVCRAWSLQRALHPLSL